MLRIEVKDASEGQATLSLAGDFTGEYIPCVEHALSGAKNASAAISLSLKHVNLVDRAAMCFLSSLRGQQVTLADCPAYVVRWMDQEDRNCS